MNEAETRAETHRPQFKGFRKGCLLKIKFIEPLK